MCEPSLDAKGATKSCRAQQRRAYPLLPPAEHSKLRESWLIIFLLIVDVQDVAVEIFEPGGFERPGDVDVTFALQPGYIIVFESNTRVLEASHDRVHFVADPPSCGCRLVAPGKLRLVDDDCRLATSQRDNVGRLSADGREAKFFQVELLGRGKTLDRTRRHSIFIC